jgi:tRNA threonylcarbamoyladenosine biosynthesis protein TsaB
MKLMVIDTSTKTLCVGVSDGYREYTYEVDYATRLSRCLVPALARVLQAAGISARQIDCFACGIGPGSFTGIRIGMACVKGLAFASSTRVCGVVSLDIIALNARREEGVIAAVIDAKRGLVYAALYRMKRDALVRLSPYMLVSPDKLFFVIRTRFGKKKVPVVFCGDGIPVIRQAASAPGRSGTAGARLCAEARFLDADYWKPQPHHALELAKERIARKEFSSALSIRPLYLYPKECQIRK